MNHSENIDIMMMMMKQECEENILLKKEQLKESVNFRIKGQQSQISKEIMRRFRIQNKKLLEQVAVLKDQLKYSNEDQKQVMQKMEFLIKLNKDISAALGSCADCWGENQECETCAGKGIGGWRSLNKRHFAQYVLPALEKLYKINQE